MNQEYDSTVKSLIKPPKTDNYLKADYNMFPGKSPDEFLLKRPHRLDTTAGTNQKEEF
jgi:hypothetical protein